MIRKHMVAKGRVQGVGFRYYCAHIAASCNVTGWVKNRYDGSVEIEVQGPEHRVYLFEGQVRQGNRFVRVDSLETSEIPLVRATQEKGFQVKYE